MSARGFKHGGLKRFAEKHDARALPQRHVERIRNILNALACISHHMTAGARDTTARTSLRLLAVLNVLFKYACARQAARASS